MRGGPRSVPEPPPQPVGWRDRLGQLRHLGRLAAQIWRTSPAMASASVVLRLLRAAQPPLALWLAKLIIDEIIHLTRITPPGPAFADWLASGRLDWLVELLALELGLLVAFDLIGRAVTLIDGILAELHANAATVELMRHAATLDLTHFESSEYQDRLERARRQAAGRNTLLSDIMGQVQDVITASILAAGLFLYAPALILLLLVALLPAVLGEAHFNAQSYRLSLLRTPERRVLEYLRYVGASVENAKEIKLFALGDFLVERFRELSQRLFLLNRELAVRRALWGALFSTISSVAYYLVYAVIAWRTIDGQFSIGDLTFLAGSFQRLHTLFGNLLLGITRMAGQTLYLDDLFSFFEITPTIRSPERPVPLPAPLRQGVVFEDVGFRYPETDRWAVRHLSFDLPAGRTLALVGENGAGKTTIVKLLTRLYDPDEGRILIDGIDLRSFDLEELRRRIGVIFQDFIRYHLTAGENIAIGRIEARDDQERIEDSAERSLADTVIEQLPLGYDQPLGRRFTKGYELSGGEWQKVAIARAYMRDADLLILDEPTAALDARSEAAVFERFKALSHGKTAILISHRFSTVRMADRILVLEHGRVLEQGTHAELLRARGRYAELFELQAAGYR